MSELRQDPITHDWVIINPDRAQRPAQARNALLRASDGFITLAPFAARVPFHIQNVPRRHSATFDDIHPNEIADRAVHLNRLLASLHHLLQDPGYNLVFVIPPLDQIHRLANHWFIDIMPRLTTAAGFELGWRIIINTEPPEHAAAELRAADRGERGS